MATQGRRALSAIVMAFIFSGTVNAAAVTIDGVRDGLDNYTHSFLAGWINGHKTDESVYNDFTDKTRVYWEHENSSLYLFMEVPIIAKNMVWGDGMTAQEITDYGKAFDFKGATGSEKVEFGYSGMTNANDTDSNSDKKSKSKDKDSKKGKSKSKDKGSKKGKSKDKDGGGDAEYEGDLAEGSSGSGIINYADSAFWLLNNGICDMNSCDATSQTMSFEFEFDTTIVDKDLLLASIENGGIAFHLSPERSVVPIPAAAWLFGSALFGMGVLRRRRNHSTD